MSLEQDEPGLSNDLRRAAAELNQRSGGCPDPPVVLAAEAGVLPAEVSVWVTRHLEHCSVCKLMARDLTRLDAAPILESERTRIWDRIRAEIPAEPVPSGSNAPKQARSVGTTSHRLWGSFFSPRWMAVSMAVVVIVGLTILVGVRLTHRARGRQQDMVAGTIHEHGSNQALVQTTPAPHSPSIPASNAFRLEKAPIRLPASAAVMVWRGEASVETGQVKELEQALAPYRADNYAGAETRLDRLAKKYPRLPEACFYLGVCQLFLNQNQEAATNLKTALALAHGPLAGDAAWYLAFAYHKNGQDNEARPLLEKICKTGGKDAAQACSALTELAAE